MVGEQVRVLLAEDDRDFRELCTEALTAAGYDVSPVADGIQALELLTRSPQDVVVSDVHMPELGGLEFLRVARARGLDVPVVMVTGDASFHIAADAVESGAYRYLVKPVDVDQLLDTVAAAHDDHRALCASPAAPVRIAKAARRSLALRFEQALGSLRLTHQPIVAPEHRSVMGFESLVTSEERTLSTAGQLFNAAWRLGALPRLGRAVWQGLLREASAAPHGALLFVPVAAEELQHLELWGDSALLASAAPRVVLQVPEHAVLDRISSLEPRLQQLRKLGFRCAIADLGASDVVLCSFARLEPAFVRLDRALVQGVESSPRKRSVIEEIVGLCARLPQTAVIAGGVETAAEYEALARVGVDLFQGNYFSRPRPSFEARWFSPGRA